MRHADDEKGDEEGGSEEGGGHSGSGVEVGGHGGCWMSICDWSFSVSAYHTEDVECSLSDWQERSLHMAGQS